MDIINGRPVAYNADGFAYCTDNRLTVFDAFVDATGTIICQVHGGDVYFFKAVVADKEAFAAKVLKVGSIDRKYWEMLYVPGTNNQMSYGEYFDGEPVYYRDRQGAR